ncbi:unnamed protein product [Dovyalis caffra]|uniref:Uncharacterized protein n=1 Tax=Dovyalis caffra TaxID=77055 RepID=A0AAV1STC0_9ROSI|nr:unnamed protein product [Dovyalis caffra]
MSTAKVYERKRKGKQFGSAMQIMEPLIQQVCAPETPEKPPPLPARPQLVYVKRCSEHDSESFLARMAAEEARDPICAIITAATSTSENGLSNNSVTPVDNCKYLDSGAGTGFKIDLNESIYDWEHNSTATAHGSQTLGDSSEGLPEGGFQSENHNLLSIQDLEESDKCGEQCWVLPYGKKQDAEHGMNDEKLPLEPVAISTPLPNRSGSKRPNNGIDLNKMRAKKPKRKKHRTKVAVEGKPKRTPKKMPKLATPKRIQEKKEKRKYVKKDATPNCMRRKKEKRNYVKKAPSSIKSSQESSVTEDHKEVAETAKMENLPVDDNKMAMVSNVNHDLKDDNQLGLDSIQPDMDNNSGATVLLSGDNLGLESNQNELRWNFRTKMSAGEYWPRPGCQYNSLQAYRRIFKEESCLINSRKVGPNVPIRSMKRRTKRRRKLNMFSSLWSSHFSGNIRKKRSKVFTKRVDFTFLMAGFAEKEKDLVTAPPDYIPIPEGQGFQTLTDGCIEEGLSLEQALTTEVNGVQVVCEATAQSCSEMGPSAAESNFQDAGPEVFEEESGTLLKTVKLAVMDKLVDLLQNSSINNNDNISDRRGPGRPKSKPEHIIDGQNALVPYRGRGRAKHEVDLGPESLRIWNQLMKIDSGVGEEEEKDRKTKEWWTREKITFNGRIDAFTSRLHQFLGDRRFKQWKGSVVDSVVGVFLTQNVSDNLSR